MRHCDTRRTLVSATHPHFHNKMAAATVQSMPVGDSSFPTVSTSLNDEVNQAVVDRVSLPLVVMMVQKQFAHRVHEFLATTSNEEKTAPPLCILDTPAVQGCSPLLRGHHVLGIPDRPDLASLFCAMSPLARQNVAWCGTVHFSADLDSVDDEMVFPPQLARSWWQELSRRHQAGVKPLLLRLQVHPKEWTARAAWHLQRQALEASHSSLDDFSLAQAFDGPIDIVMGRPRATHQFNVVMVPRQQTGWTWNGSTITPASSTTTPLGGWTCYWGVQCRHQVDDARFMNVPLNHCANDEAPVAAQPHSHVKKRNRTANSTTDSANPESTSAATVTSDFAAIDIAIPVSRAYYKLQQVWNEYLERDGSMDYWLPGDAAAALDLGAAPGGWTQLLLQKNLAAAARPLFTRIVAVDPGALAHRIRAQNLTHVAATLELVDLTPHGPFSLVVCDASFLWSDLLPVIIQLIQRHGPTSTAAPLFRLPCTWVITMKLPFKTEGSIARQVSRMHERLGDFVQTMGQKMYGADQHTRSHFRLLHLMANSYTERTVLIRFEPTIES
jgi:FtsJ-like methyltransferase